MPISGPVNKGKGALRIAVDIRTLCDGKSGVETSGIQTAVIAFLNQLQRLDTTNEYFLFETRKSTYQPYNEKWEKVLLPTFRIPAIVWMQFIFPYYLLKYNIDVLWAPKVVCPFWFIKKIRVYTTIYDLGYLHFPATLLCKDKIELRLLVPLSAKRSTAVITDSVYIKKDFEQNFQSIKTPVIAIPLGKSDWTIPDTYSPEKRQDFLFFAGNLEPRKNLLNAIKALEILYSEGKSIELQIASPGGWKNHELLDYIERSPIKSWIKLLGFISLADLQQKYLSCKALVYPSFYEGFGLPVLEALTLDCLVLTSKNTVMQEVAEESALYFDPFDPHDIADTIRVVYSGTFDRDSYLKHTKRILEKYSWELSARKMLSVFEASNKD